MHLEGFVDIADAATVEGWAWSPDAPFEPLYVDVYDGEVLLARLRADLFRKDLADASIGDGCHGFRYAVDEARRDGGEHDIHVRFHGTRLDLANSPRQILFGESPHRSPELARVLRTLAPAATWNIDAVEVYGDSLALHGWALPPLTGHRGTFAVNGVRLSTHSVSFPRWRPDVASVFWYVPHSARSGFQCNIDWRGLGYSECDVLKVDYVDQQCLRPWGEYQSFYVRPDLLHSRYPIPPEESILRVAGYTSTSKFLLDGYTTLLKLEEVLQRFAGRSVREFSAVLDWGCGCGRLSRQLLDRLNGTGAILKGVDIDPLNVAWCQSNLPGGSFGVCQLAPPTQEPSAAFDLIIGISVLTHLDEGMQHAWLAELKRVSRQGAILLLSVHGNTSACRSNTSLEWLNQWHRRGVDDNSKDCALSAVIQDTEYYRTTFHTIPYIRRCWAAYFDVVAVLEGVLSNNQDLVVLRAQ